MIQSSVNHSKYILLLCFGILAYSSLVFYPRWQQPRSEALISYDVEGYYYYLPALFIYKDIKTLSFKDSIINKYQASGTGAFLHGFKDEQSGNYILKYTCGMSVLYLPAFVVAHLVALSAGFPADGFSAPYQLSLQIWGLIFAFIGLYYLRKLLLLYFSDKVAAVVLLLLVLGTNYLNYAAIDVGMSHSWLFTLYVLLILNTHHCYRTFLPKYAINVGLIVGLLVLIRPTEVISCFIPLLWGLESFEGIKERFQLIARKKKIVACSIVSAGLVVLVQLFYWYYVSGHWLVYSYQDQGFNFIRPHAFVYSWSYKSGWLRYTPMMLLAFLGFLMYPRLGKNRFAVMIFFVLNYYIVSAWNLWGYGGFSGRAMIQSYPVLLFCVALVVEFIATKFTIVLAVVPFIILFIYINIWWTYQAHSENGLVDPNCTTKEYYWKMVGRWSLPERYIKLKDTDELPDSEPKSLKLLYTETRNKIFCINETNHINRVSSISSFNLDKSKWIRVSANFQSFQKEWDVWRMPHFIVEFKKQAQVVKTKMFRTHRFLSDYQVRNLFLDVRVPDQQFDSLLVSYWNPRGDKKNCLNNLKVYSFN